jgi:methyltransferase family protein
MSSSRPRTSRRNRDDRHLFPALYRQVGLKLDRSDRRSRSPLPIGCNISPRTNRLSALFLAVMVSWTAVVVSARQTPESSSHPLDVIYIPTPSEVVTAMLQMASVGKNDIVYDLGSGDGRIVIAAVRDFGAKRGVGIELDAARVQEAVALARQAGVSDRVEFRRQDFFETDMRDATVVTLYLGEAINLRVRPKLQNELRPGTRVVSHAFSMGDWIPDVTRTVSGRAVFLWMIR